jgi:hypothetical protein
MVDHPLLQDDTARVRVMRGDIREPIEVRTGLSLAERSTLTLNEIRGMSGIRRNGPFVFEGKVTPEEMEDYLEGVKRLYTSRKWDNLPEIIECKTLAEFFVTAASKITGREMEYSKPKEAFIETIKSLPERLIKGRNMQDDYTSELMRRMGSPGMTMLPVNMGNSIFVAERRAFFTLLKNEIKIQGKLPFLSDIDFALIESALSQADRMHRMATQFGNRTPHSQNILESYMLIVYLKDTVIYLSPPHIEKMELKDADHNIIPKDIWKFTFGVTENFYKYDGHFVPNKIIEAPQTLTKHDLRFERNAETKRIIGEILGANHYAQLLDLTPISTETVNGQEVVLLKTVQPDPHVGGFMKFVKVKCHSTGRIFYIPVAPHLENARDAVAWSFWMDRDEYYPIKEA